MNIDIDYVRDFDPDPAETRSQCKNDPICRSCGDRFARVVRYGECESCADLTDDSRCDELQRRAS